MEIYKQRRQKLMKTMEEGVAILYAPSSLEKDQDFYYLTGLKGTKAVLVLLPHEDQTILFVPPKDPEVEAWVGSMVGVEGAVEIYGADQAFPIEELEEKLLEFLSNQQQLYYSFGWNEGRDRFIHKVLHALRRKVRDGITVPTVFHDLRAMVAEMRLIKDEDEIQLLRKAGDITANAILSAMKALRPGMFECEVQGIIEGEFRKQGGMENSFESILAGGKNALVIHYEANEDQLCDGDLLLMDVGSKYKSYSADISRTIPVDGKFTQPQREIYNLVRKAQLELIQMAKPGLLYDDFYQRSLRILTGGLVELGILEGDVEKLIEDKKYWPFFMHKTGHWLGLDCHDVGTYGCQGKSRPLKVGMVFTIEPGLYIPNKEEVPKAYRGIGVRIEDDILLTENGAEILTSALPSSIEKIEEIMKGE